MTTAPICATTPNSAAAKSDEDIVRENIEKELQKGNLKGRAATNETQLKTLDTTRQMLEKFPAVVNDSAFLDNTRNPTAMKQCLTTKKLVSLSPAEQKKQLQESEKKVSDLQEEVNKLSQSKAELSGKLQSIEVEHTAMMETIKKTKKHFEKYKSGFTALDNLVRPLVENHGAALKQLNSVRESLGFPVPESKPVVSDSDISTIRKNCKELLNKASGLLGTLKIDLFSPGNIALDQHTESLDTLNELNTLKNEFKSKVSDCFENLLESYLTHSRPLLSEKELKTAALHHGESFEQAKFNQEKTVKENKQRLVDLEYIYENWNDAISSLSKCYTILRAVYAAIPGQDSSIISNDLKHDYDRIQGNDSLELSLENSHIKNTWETVVKYHKSKLSTLSEEALTFYNSKRTTRRGWTKQFWEGLKKSESDPKWKQYVEEFNLIDTREGFVYNNFSVQARRSVLTLRKVIDFLEKQITAKTIKLDLQVNEEVYQASVNFSTSDTELYKKEINALKNTLCAEHKQEIKMLTEKVNELKEFLNIQEKNYKRLDDKEGWEGVVPERCFGILVKKGFAGKWEPYHIPVNYVSTTISYIPSPVNTSGKSLLTEQMMSDIKDEVINPFSNETQVCDPDYQKPDET